MRPPRFVVFICADELSLSVSGNCACRADDAAGGCGQCEVIEGFCYIGELCALLGYQYEGTLYHIAAILYCFLTGSYTVYYKCLDGILYCCERSVTDSAGVACDGSCRSPWCL